MTDGIDREQRARMMLLDLLPTGSNWTDLRAAIGSGTLKFHSDPMSWAIEAAIKGMLEFADAERAATVEACAKVAEQWCDPIEATHHENRCFTSIAAQIRALNTGKPHAKS